MKSLSDHDANFGLAIRTPEKIFGVCPARDGDELCEPTFGDGAVRAIQLSPERLLKVRKALLREARRIAFRQKLRLPAIYFGLLLLNISKLRLDTQAAYLRALRYVCG